MSVVAQPVEFTVAFTAEERELLLTILDQVVHDKRIEVRRTEALDYKRFVEHQEALLQQIINKLRQT